MEGFLGENQIQAWEKRIQRAREQDDNSKKKSAEQSKLRRKQREVRDDVEAVLNEFEKRP